MCWYIDEFQWSVCIERVDGRYRYRKWERSCGQELSKYKPLRRKNELTCWRSFSHVPEVGQGWEDSLASHCLAKRESRDFVWFVIMICPARKRILSGQDKLQGIHWHLPAPLQLLSHNERSTNLSSDKACNIHVQQSAICVYDNQTFKSRPRAAHLCVPPIPDKSDRVLPD